MTDWGFSEPTNGNIATQGGNAIDTQQAATGSEWDFVTPSTASNQAATSAPAQSSFDNGGASIERKPSSSSAGGGGGGGGGAGFYADSPQWHAPPGLSQPPPSTPGSQGASARGGRFPSYNVRGPRRGGSVQVLDDGWYGSPEIDYAQLEIEQKQTMASVAQFKPSSSPVSSHDPLPGPEMKQQQAGVVEMPDIIASEEDKAKLDEWGQGIAPQPPASAPGALGLTAANNAKVQQQQETQAPLVEISAPQPEHSEPQAIVASVIEQPVDKQVQQADNKGLEPVLQALQQVRELQVKTTNDILHQIEELRRSFESLRLSATTLGKAGAPTMSTPSTSVTYDLLTPPSGIQESPVASIKQQNQPHRAQHQPREASSGSAWTQTSGGSANSTNGDRSNDQFVYPGAESVTGGW